MKRTSSEDRNIDETASTSSNITEGSCTGVASTTTEVSHIAVASYSDNIRTEPNAGTNSDNVLCSACQKEICRRYYSNHLKSNVHKNNVLRMEGSLKNVSVIESAFGQRIITYRICKKSNQTLETTFQTPEIFMNSIKDDIFQLIERSIVSYSIFKVKFIFNAEFIQQNKNDTHNTFDFQTSNYIIFRGDDLDIFFASLTNTLTNKVSSFEKKDSGWSLKQIISMDMNVNKFNPLRGTSYIDLPQDIRAKKAVINVQNVDYMCFKWALLSALYPVNNNAGRVSSYSMHAHKVNFDGLSFPIKLNDIHKVENLNNISINVYGLEFNRETKRNSVIGPLYFTKCRKSIHINLLYLTNDFEAFLNPVSLCANDPSKFYTNNIHKHEPYSFGYYMKCSYDDNLSKYEFYSGPNCVQIFMSRLYSDIRSICSKKNFQKAPNTLTDKDKNIIDTCTICHICETILNEDKILDFDWYAGNFRGVAHELCTKKFRAPNFVPVFLHNLSHYDSHFIVHALNFVEGQVDIIPQNKEKYISFTKLRFVDSFKFLPCSLSQLTKNLKDEKFHTLRTNFPNNEDFVRLKKKGVYPNEFVTSYRKYKRTVSYESLELTSLPSQQHFYSTLTDSKVSDDDYHHAQDVWDHFQCSNMLVQTC
ncbi:unnamed protein product [Euphydryas editha]|uniref:DNA-directed DNA polymerase n=1 Tax=Euphydryas editha TaxID=104508 RepID=A0AAU9VAK4_EUPED|nr:unnamed protein product [Euphydryas editha]